MIADAEAILKVCGIGTYLQIGCKNSPLVFELLKRSIDAHGLDESPEVIAHNSQRAPGRFTQGSLTNYPFSQIAFDTIILGNELLKHQPQDSAMILNALKSMTNRHLVLYFPDVQLHSNTQSIFTNRLFWEKVAIQAGYRRHPRSMQVISYEEHENEHANKLIFFEKVPDEADKKFPLSWLLATRDLHMDMLREAGRRSDGHVSRYVHAAKRIRKGDTVLDAACGLGYGTAVLAACSPGAKFIGVDIDPDSVEYARLNYASSNSNIEFNASDVTNLSFIPDHSIDTVVSFETIEHVLDYDAFLAEVKRVLKPDGRFIGSVPHKWCDETGKDPNPYHYHVFDWNKLYHAISRYFIVDERIAQVAGGGYKLHEGKRVMQTIPLHLNAEVETEWWIISAFANPLESASIPYQNMFETHNASTVPVHIDFSQYYNNPWIYRVIVQLGERIQDKQTLVDLCSKIVLSAKRGSADQGAALCVIAYQILESGNVQFNDFASLAKLINEYDEAYDKSNPHAYRWAVSLHYIGGRLLLALGQRDEAFTAFLACAEMDPLHFCPLLATKTISSYLYAGLLSLDKDNTEKAKHYFSKAIQESHRVLQGNWVNIIGSAESPLPFGLQEAAEILDIASQCAQVLNAIDKQSLSPGYLWDKVNLRRFGLVEWNKSVERENSTLRELLAKKNKIAVGV